jgi:hypothetical protein
MSKPLSASAARAYIAQAGHSSMGRHLTAKDHFRAANSH